MGLFGSDKKEDEYVSDCLEAAKKCNSDIELQALAALEKLKEELNDFQKGIET